MIMEKSIEEAAFAPAETFTAALNGNIDVLMNTQTVVKETEVNNETGKNGMHSKHGPATDLKVTPIYVELTPEGETLVNENISTLGEIKTLVTETGADISLVDSINRQVFYLSDEAIICALPAIVAGLVASNYLIIKS